MKNILHVIDFETTGLSLTKGARAIEVAVVKIIDGELVGSFQTLMNPGQVVPNKITNLTGISQRMVDGAPSCRWAMTQLIKYVGNSTLIAHNAKFDEGFFNKEIELAGLAPSNDFLCTIKLARKIYPLAPKYSLSFLMEYADIKSSTNYHRALADATATGNLLVQMQSDIRAKFNKPVESIEGLISFIAS